MSYQHILVDDPRPRVRRITLNRPEKRNALNNRLRAEVFEVLEQADRDPEVSISIVRGAGPCFSAGYDLSADNRVDQPYHSAAGPGQWSRHVVEGWFGIWDLAKPVIAQVHGYCLAGGTELATACDIVYVADDAQIGYPPVRLMSPPDMQYHPWLVGMRRAMELMLTGDAMSGREAAEWGFATRSFPLGRTRSAHAGFRRARRQGAGGIAAAQQALGASRDGDHGRARRDARRHRNPGAGVHHRGHRATTCRRSAAMAQASSRSSTSATRRSGITARGRSRRTLIPSPRPSATTRSSRRTANRTPRPAASRAASPPSARPTDRRRRRRVRSGSPPARSCWRCSG